MTDTRAKPAASSAFAAIAAFAAFTKPTASATPAASAATSRALTWSLQRDSGASPSDGITNNGTVVLGNLQPGDRWSYSVDSGRTWWIGIGNTLQLSAGWHAAGSVQFQRTSASGVRGEVTKIASPLTIDTYVAPLGLRMANSKLVDGIVRTNGVIDVVGLESGARWEYSVNAGKTWQTGTGTRFTVPSSDRVETGYSRDAVQIRQVDLAGNASAVTRNMTDFRVVLPPKPLALALQDDTGASKFDGITRDGRLKVSGLDAGSSWKYSVDGGKSWLTGVGGTLELLANRSYAADTIKVRQVNALGAEGTITSLAQGVTVDTRVGLLGLSMAKSVMVDGIVRSNGLFQVTALEAGARWEYSINAGRTWQAGSGSSFKVPSDTRAETTYGLDAVQVRQIDLAGNVSIASRNPTSFRVAPPPGAVTLTLKNDTGDSSSDGITSDGQLLVSGLLPGARWTASLDGGKTWQAGNGNTLKLAAGQYGPGRILVRQIDAVDVEGPVSSPGRPLNVDTWVDKLTASLVKTVHIDGMPFTDGLFRIEGLEGGARWQYSLDGGKTWQAGSAAQFRLPPPPSAEGTTQVDYLPGAVQVRQVDAAGNTSAITRHDSAFTVVAPPRLPSLTLRHDTGAKDHDGITRDGTMAVGRIDAGARWQYSVDGGTRWQEGSGSDMGGASRSASRSASDGSSDTGASFVLARGSHAAGSVQVRQINALGNTSEPTVYEQALQIELGLTLVRDTGGNDTGGSDGRDSDGITQDGTLQVQGLQPGLPWQYTLDAGRTWRDGSASTFSLPTTRGNPIRNSDFKAGGEGWTSDFDSASAGTSFPGLSQGLLMSVKTGQAGSGDPGFHVRQLDANSTSRNAWSTTIEVVDTGDHVFSGYATYGASASPQTGYFTILVDGVQMGGARHVTVNGGWQAFSQTLSGLTAGTHTLSVRAVRPGDNSSKTLFGLDSLHLGPVGANPLYTPHAVRVRQTLADGEVLTGSLASTVEIDVRAPEAARLSVITDASHGASRIAITQLEAGVRQSLSIDGGDWLQLETGSSFMPQTGTHTYRVRQVDVAGLESVSATLSHSAPALTPTQVRALARDWLPCFSVPQLTAAATDGSRVLELLGDSQIPGLSLGQLLARDGDGKLLLSRLSEAQVQGLSAGQIGALPTSAFELTVASGHTLLDALGNAQVTALTREQLLSVDAAGQTLWGRLDAAQVRSLSLEQVRVLPAKALAAPDVDGDGGEADVTLLEQLTAQQLAGLSNSQLLALDESGAKLLQAQSREETATSLSSALVRDAFAQQLKAVDYSGLLSFFQTIGQGLRGRTEGLSTDEFQDLRLITRFVGEQTGRSGYLHGVCNSLVNGDKYNTWWTAGGTSQTAMGNLRAGSDAVHLDRLTRTWFLGQNNPIEAAGTQYDGDPLWQAGGPLTRDVDQGSYGDCTAMSAMAAICAMDPTFVQALFTDNGNGTYGVRVGGNHYTFDRNFSARGSSAHTGVLWPRLLEEAWYAYAYDHLTFPSMAYESPYINIEPYGGSAMINLSARQTDANSSWARTSLNHKLGLDAVRAALKTALQNHEYVSFGSSSTRGGRVDCHQYAVLSLDEVTDRVELYNPWGYRASYALSDLQDASGDTFFVVNNPVSRYLPRALGVELATDTGTSASDGITSSQVLKVTGLAAGQRWQFSLDGQMSWQDGGVGTGNSGGSGDSGERIFLREGSYDAQRIVVRTLSADGSVTDMGGNDRTLVVDRQAPTPVLRMTDSGSSDHDAITANATVRVDRLEAGGGWQFRIDDAAWQAGSGSSIQAVEGEHRYAVRQVDAAGNASDSGSIALTLDRTAPQPAGFRLVSSAGRQGILQIQPTEDDARLEASLDFGKTWQDVWRDVQGRHRVELPELDGALNRIAQGNFRPAATRDWDSDYGVTSGSVPPAKLRYGFNSGLSAGQEGGDDPALVVQDLDVGGARRDVWSTTVELASGASYQWKGHLAGAVSSGVVEVDYQLLVDDRVVGGGSLGSYGWQPFSHTLRDLGAGQHTVAIRASMGNSYVTSLFAVDSLSLTRVSDTPIYEAGALQVRHTDLAGNARLSHNVTDLDWTRLDTNLAVL